MQQQCSLATDSVSWQHAACGGLLCSADCRVSEIISGAECRWLAGAGTTQTFRDTTFAGFGTPGMAALAPRKAGYHEQPAGGLAFVSSANTRILGPEEGLLNAPGTCPVVMMDSDGSLTGYQPGATALEPLALDD